VPGLQEFWAQQPVGHVVASQTQSPPTQVSPVPQGFVLPHRQLPANRPVAGQLSALVGLQITQLPPRTPQVVTDADSQTPFLQHPAGQVFLLQTHAPLTQAVPLRQGALVPQRQVPVNSSQELAIGETHATQACPPVPHVADAGAAQIPLAQQPFGHDCALQVQVPPTQVVPAVQDGTLPQRHVPDTEQLSAREGSHVTHAAPPAPQAPEAPVVHVDPEQQPVKQLVGLQSLQTPPAQGPAPQF
jgi:hypothetical protein